MLSWMSVFEWSGCLLGIVGAVLMAVQSPKARWAFVLWLISNLCWTIYGLSSGNMALALQQGAFCITSAMGIWHWFRPRPAGGYRFGEAATSS